MKRPNLDEYYLNIALAVSQRSTCLKKHYGAVLVNPNKGIVSTGYNGAPCGESHCTNCTKTSHGKDLSTFLECKSVHAEMNCIINASKQEMIGSTLYLACSNVECNTELLNPEPCEICLRLIKNSGVDKVITKNGLIYVRNQFGILERGF